MGPRRKRPELGDDVRLRVAAAATPSLVKKTPSTKRAVTPKTPVADDTQHDAAVAIASLDVDRGLHERIERVARRVQRLQRELGEVWEDMQRLLDPGAVAMEEVHPGLRVRVASLGSYLGSSSPRAMRATTCSCVNSMRQRKGRA